MSKLTAKKSSSQKDRSQRVAIAIMAAGKGTRLKSRHPKVLHEVGGKPILAHVIATATKVVPAKDIFVIAHASHRFVSRSTSLSYYGGVMAGG